MKKILVPIDFSENCENALVYALEMAKLYKAELVLLHTFELPISESQITPINYAEIYEAIEQSNSDQFKDEMPRFEEIAKSHAAGHITMSHIMKPGELIYNIKEVVKHENIDFVVMGTNGASGWFESLIGTNTSSVISEIEVPVLSISHDTKFHKMETIGFRTRYKEDEIYALNEVMDLAKRIGAKVKCLYVKTPDSGFKGERIEYWESIFENEKNLDFFAIPSDNVETAIEDFIVNQSIDLMAMVEHRKNFFARLFTTSNTEKMSLHSKTPILALHD